MGNYTIKNLSALITKAEGYFDEAATAIETKGGTKPTTMAELAEGIESIPSSGITPAGTLDITANGTYDVTNYASAEVNVSGGSSSSYYDGSVDEEGLKAIGWTDEDMANFRDNIPHYSWEDDRYKVSDTNKSYAGKTAEELKTATTDSEYNRIKTVAFPPKSSLPTLSYEAGNYESSYYYVSEMYYNYKCPKAFPTLTLDSSMTAFTYEDSSPYCYSLFCNNTELEVAPKINNFNYITSMYSMFNGCNSLKSVPKYDTSNVTNFYGVFYGCSLLGSIPDIDTSNGTNFTQMFRGCTSLKYVPPINTSNGTNFSYMFYGCSFLSEVPVINTSKGEDFSYMFQGCTVLTSIPELDTSSGTNFKWMFNGDTKLTSIPKLNLSGGTDFNSTFSSCSALTDITLEGSINATITFASCTKLTYDSVKSILTAASNTTNTDAKKLTFKVTLTDQDSELANLVSACTSLGWTVSGLTLN